MGNLGLIPGLGISTGIGKDYSLQYSCLENSMDRRAWQATVHGVAESDMAEQLSHTHTHTAWLAQMLKVSWSYYETS